MTSVYILGKSDDEKERVKIVRKGAKNWRVEFEDGVSELVPVENVDTATEQEDTEPPYDSKRIIPLTPLHRLYREFRDLTGKPRCKFEAIKLSLTLQGRLAAPLFLAELFSRSCQQSETYDNRLEHFLGRPGTRKSKRRSGFAMDLIDALSEQSDLRVPGVDDLNFSYVEYEVSPFRTTKSFTESGSSARASGVGGMDFLLCSMDNPPFPIVAEVKANTETVGPTFALVQALKYASEIVSAQQWARLAKHFPVFEKLPQDDENRMVDIYLLFEDDEPNDDHDEDLLWMTKTATLLIEDPRVKHHIRRIVVLTGTLDKVPDTAVATFHCEFRTDG
jgi:hypothetical protein